MFGERKRKDIENLGNGVASRVYIFFDFQLVQIRPSTGLIFSGSKCVKRYNFNDSYNIVYLSCEQNVLRDF